jgi:short-subunit dehydrogenase
MAEAQWRAGLELNLMTMFRCTHLVLPSMLERASGRIINIGSAAGFIGDRPGRTTLTAT